MTDNQQNTAGLAAMEAPLSPPRSDSPVDSNSVDSNSLSTAPLSIRQLALLHPRERLLVPPTNWTPRHLEVLRCSFSEPAPAPATALAGKPQGGDYLRHEMERWVWRSPSGRSDTVRDLIGGAFTSQRNIGFYFHQRQVQILTCDLLFCKVDESFDQTLKDNPDALPPIVAAYVDLHQIDSARMEHFGVFKISRYRPMRRRLLCLNKLKKAKSTNHLHDPYIAALLIAIAQDDMHFARDLSAISSWTPQVLVSSDDTENFHLYKASISHSFLRAFDNPTIAPSEPVCMPIQISTIPFQPYESLSDRIIALLLSEQTLERKRESED